jgi:hypothetical protein
MHSDADDVLIAAVTMLPGSGSGAHHSMGVAGLIEIQETSTELLLYIPASQKERAKAIEGRAWDPQRKCWVYRKTKRAYDALIAEFGDDLVPGSAPPPPLPNPATRIVSPGDNETLAEIRSLREELRASQRQTGAAPTVVEPPISAEEGRSLALAGLVTELQEQKQIVLEAKRDAANWRAQALTAQRDNARLRDELARAPESTRLNGKGFTLLLRGLAVETAGSDERFQQILDEVKLTKDFAMLIVPSLEQALRHILNISEADKISLFELIAQAKDGQILSDDAVDMAHLLRKQGNILKHGNPDPKTIPARRLLSLYAAAILWPELSVRMGRPASPDRQSRYAAT